MKGRATAWSPAELAWIEANRHRPRAEAHVAFCARFDRADVNLSNYAALCKRKGWLTGRTGRFAKGEASWNKGQSMPFHPNSAATRFKPGGVPKNRKPLGDQRMAKDGYIEVKVELPNPYTGHRTRYIHKHRYLWEQANGPLPKGMALKCLDGNRLNTDPANWQAIPRALLPRLNGRFGRNYDEAPPELKPVILAIAKLEHAARAKSGGKDETNHD